MTLHFAFQRYPLRDKAATCLGTAIVLSLISGLAGCIEVGPDYREPIVKVNSKFVYDKGGVIWKAAQPSDTTSKGNWWSVFYDPKLDRMMRLVDVSNQKLIAQVYAFQTARATLQKTRAQLFPLSSTGSPRFTRQQTGAGTDSTSQLQGVLSWQLNLFGALSRQIEQSGALMQASAAQLAAVRLSIQCQLLLAYFQIQYSNSLEDLYQNTIKAYERSLEITRNQYEAGIVQRSDVLQAEATLESTKYEAQQVQINRAKAVNALLVLLGRFPKNLVITNQRLPTKLPKIPRIVPSRLLERRPDIAQAERNVAASSAEIGVAVSAYYPDLKLSYGTDFFRNESISSILSGGLFALAGTSGVALFDGGSRAAGVLDAYAGYQQSLHQYKETVLEAFQEVENELVTLFYLQQQISVQTRAAQASTQAVELVMNAYRAGTKDYTAVLTAQFSQLKNQQKLIELRYQNFVALINLIGATGGGWTRNDLPSFKDMY